MEAPSKGTRGYADPDDRAYRTKEIQEQAAFDMYGAEETWRKENERKQPHSLGGDLAGLARLGFVLCLLCGVCCCTPFVAMGAGACKLWRRRKEAKAVHRPPDGG